MIFQRQQPKILEEINEVEIEEAPQHGMQDEVETVVGPSVNVEGDFASEGNIVVKLPIFVLNSFLHYFWMRFFKQSQLRNI